MSTTSQTFAVLPATATRTATSERKVGFFGTMFARFIKAREAEANRRVSQFLANQSDERLGDLGFSARDIAEIRASGRIPASYFE